MSVRRLAVLFIAAALSLAIASEAFARGGAPWLDSPGYQRALAESRKKPTLQLQQDQPTPGRQKKTGTQ